MIKNILIISSDYTGHGHKSITESLCEKFAQYNEINVIVIDGFALGGKALIKIAKSYGVITRNARELWKLIWKLSMSKPQLIDQAMELVIKTKLLDLLEQVKPDLILSVHPNFNGSVLNVLEQYKIKIPFITLIADLVSISPNWVDSRVDYIISPTNEAKKQCLRFKFPESKVKVLGFPVRSRFHKTHVEYLQKSKKGEEDIPLKCLIISGGEGSGDMSKIASKLLDNFNCTVKIIAGRNKMAKKRLENTLFKKYGKKVEVFGFVNNLNDLMRNSDIAFTRGSPNVMMESISCNVPLVITGALPGQEEGNPEFALKYNLGVVCNDLKNLNDVVNNLVSNNARKLNIIKESQKHFFNPETAKNIVDFIISLDNNNDTMLA